MDKTKEINERVFSLMKERKISGYKLMKNLSIPEGTISQARHNKAGFTVVQLLKISEYFNVSLDYIITGNDYDSEKTQDKIKKLIEENNDLKDKIKKIDDTLAVFDKVKNLVYKTK